MSKPVGNIASVAKRTGKVALQNVSIQVLVVPAVNGFEKISMMALAALEIFDSLALLVAGDRAAVIGHDHISTLAVDDHADAGELGNFELVDDIDNTRKGIHALFSFALVRFPGRQTAHFEDKRRFGIIMKNDLRIRRGAVINVANAAADSEDAWRKFVFAEEPACNVHLVDSLVAQIAIACWPHPMPIVVQPFAHERLHRRGTAPEIIIDPVRDWLRTIDFSNAGPPLVTKTAGNQNLSQVAGLHPLNCFANPGAGTALRSCLHNFVVRARELNELPAFPNVVTNRLFYIDIFAGLNSPNRRQGVPMIRRGD